MSVASILASIALFVPMPHGTNVVTHGCPADRTLSCARGDGTVYLSPSDLRAGYPDAHLALAHELGHEWDLQHLSDADRERYRLALGLTRTDWFPTLNDEVTPDGRLAPAEYFADAYALCSMSPRYRRWLRHHGGYEGSYGETFNRLAIAETCWLIHARSGTLAAPALRVGGQPTAAG